MRDADNELLPKAPEQRLLALVYTVGSESPAALQAAKDLAMELTPLNRIFTSVAIAFPGGAEKRTIRDYRLGDLFEMIAVVSDHAHPSTSFNLVFVTRCGADRFWKDVVVSTLSSIRKCADGVSVKLVARSY